MKLTIGENIRDYRRKQDLTQEEFAECLGVSYQSVSRWENGATSVSYTHLAKIQTALPHGRRNSLQHTRSGMARSGLLRLRNAQPQRASRQYLHVARQDEPFERKV